MDVEDIPMDVEDEIEDDVEYDGEEEDGDDATEIVGKKQRKQRTGRKSIFYPKPRRSKAAGKATKSGKPRKPPRSRPGLRALREIRFYQKSTDLVIQKLPFERLIREIAQVEVPDGIRFKTSAVEALRTCGEQLLTDIFALAVHSQINDGRQTLMPKDMKNLAQMQCGDDGMARALRDFYK